MTILGCCLAFKIDFKGQGLLSSCFLKRQEERQPLSSSRSVLSTVPGMIVSCRQSPPQRGEAGVSDPILQMKKLRFG